MVTVLPQEDEMSLVVAQGELDVDQLIAAYGEYLGGNPALLTLWDLSSASLRQIDVVDLRTLAQRVAEEGKGVRSRRARSAVVCARAVDYGLIRVLLAYLVVESYPVRIAVFMNRDEAKAWLRDDAAE
jgi:hypothetical protein